MHRFTPYFTIWLFNQLVKYMPPDQLSRTLSALADPTRRALLTRLSRGETSVTELAKPFRMTMPAVSKHLKVLERAKLIARGRNAQWRPCTLRAAPLKEVSQWVGGFREYWEASFDRLDEYLTTLQRTPARRAAAGKARKKRSTQRSKHGL